jgi:DNA-binding transcriptional MerR regulator
MVNLKHIKELIESLSLQQQVFIGKMFYDENVNMFENKNGVFINLTEVDDLILEKINVHLQQIKEQEQTLNQMEVKKQEYKDNYFTKVNEICE